MTDFASVAGARLAYDVAGAGDLPMISVRADSDRSWRTAFVRSMFLPTDLARREAIVAEFPAMEPGAAAALLQAMADFDGAAVLGWRHGAGAVDRLGRSRQLLGRSRQLLGRSAPRLPGDHDRPDGRSR